MILDFLSSLEAWTKNVVEIAETVGQEKLQSDLISQLALSKAVEQCGEISAQILRRWPDLETRYPELELRQAQDMRNRLVHGYDTVSLRILWLTATTSIPDMNSAVRVILAARNSDEP